MPDSPIQNVPSYVVLLASATAASGIGTVFEVGARSLVCRIKSGTDDDAGVADSCELRHVLDYDASDGSVNKSTKAYDKTSGTSVAITLGGDGTSVEILHRGLYVWSKIAVTTPLIGVEATPGMVKLP